jgi:flagellar motility protein MotE (MotC chaperone)
MAGTDVAQGDAAGKESEALAAKRKPVFLRYLAVWLPFPLMLGALVVWQLRTGQLQPKPAEGPDASMFEGAGAEIPVLLEALGQERARLAQEWDELRDTERRVLIEKTEIEARRQEVEDLLARLDDRLQNISDERAGMLDQLARVYETMKPDAAAAILAGMDAETATEVLRRMKERSAAAVLAKIPKESAAEISRRMLRGQ